MFAQTTAILTSRLPSLEELEAALADLHVGKRVSPAPDAGAFWLTGRGGVVIPSGSGTRGRVVVMDRQRVRMVIDPSRRSCLARKLWLV